MWFRFWFKLVFDLFEEGHSEKQYTQNAMVFKQGAFSPRMPWFLNGGHSEKQCSQNAMVSEQGAFWKTVLPECQSFRVICSSLALLAKDTCQLERSGKPCNNVKIPPLSWGHWKKMPSSGLQNFGPLQALLDFVTTMRQGLNSHKIQNSTESNNSKMTQSERGWLAL